MLVSVSAGDDCDDATNDFGLSQSLEKALIFAKFVQCCTGVQSHMKILIFVGELIDKGADNHIGFLLKNLLHKPLVLGELWVSVIAVIVAVVARLPLVLHLGLDLLLNQLDH